MSFSLDWAPCVPAALTWTPSPSQHWRIPGLSFPMSLDPPWHPSCMSYLTTSLWSQQDCRNSKQTSNSSSFLAVLHVLADRVPRGTQLCWFPRKNFPHNDVLLALPYLLCVHPSVLYCWFPDLLSTFACRPGPPHPHSAVGCHFSSASFLVSSHLFQVGQPVGKDALLFLIR